MWESHDFIIHVDGTFDDLGTTKFDDEAVNEWREVFRNPVGDIWYVLVDQPDFVVMRALTGPLDDQRLRFSINVPVKE